MPKNNFASRHKFETWVREFGGTERLSKALGVSQSSVQHWMHGHCRPRLKTAGKILQLAGKNLTIHDIAKAFHDARKLW